MAKKTIWKTVFFGKTHPLTNYLWVPRLPTTFLAGDVILGAAVWEPRTLLPSSERLHRHMEDDGNHGPEILRWSTRFFWGAFFLIANREITREQLRSPEGFFLGSLQSLNRFGVWLLTLFWWTKNGAIKKGALTKVLPSGKLTVCYGKSPCSIGNSAISMAMFNGYVSHYQRVTSASRIS